MSAYQINLPENFGAASRYMYLVLTVPHADKTAVVFAQHPANSHAGSVVNFVSDIAKAAFKQVPNLDRLDDGKVEFYTTFRYVPEKSRHFKQIRGAVARVVFNGGGKLKNGGLLYEKEWSFGSAKWVEHAGPDFVRLVDEAAWKAGFAPQVYDPQAGWSIPAMAESD